MSIRFHVVFVLLVGAPICSQAFVAAQDISPAAQVAASLTGQVRDGNGMPLQGEIDIVQRLIHNGSPRPAVWCSVRTDASGAYSCSMLAPGRYVAVVRPDLPDGLEKTAGSKQSEFEIPAFAFCPGDTDLNNAFTLTLHQHDRVTCDFNLEKQGAYTVSGQLRDAPPWARFALSAEADDWDVNTNLAPDYSPRDGRFAFRGVPNGHYVLRVSWSAAGARYHTETTFVVSGQDVEGLEMRSQRNTKVIGKIESQTGEECVGCRIVLQSRTGRQDDQAAAVKNDGSFAFSSVPSGEYVVGLMGDSSSYVGSVSVNGAIQQSADINVSADGNTQRLTVDLDAGSASIQGNLDLAATGVSGALVEAQSEESGEIWTTTPDKSGAFSIHGLAPGDYLLYAWADADEAEY